MNPIIIPDRITPVPQDHDKEVGPGFYLTFRYFMSILSLVVPKSKKDNNRPYQEAIFTLALLLLVWVRLGIFMMKRKPPLTKETIDSLFNVDAKTGKLYFKNKHGSQVNVIGREAGFYVINSKTKYKRWEVGINRQKYRRSYIIYCFTTGCWPKDILDHIDGNSLNDRFDNLRECNQHQNLMNNKSRNPKGAYIDPSKRKRPYRAMITLNRKIIRLGRFSTFKQAHEVYLNARKKYFGEFA